MKKLRNLVTLVAILGMVAFITGCDDDDDNDNNNGNNNPAVNAPADLTAFTGQTFTLTDANGNQSTLRFPANGQYELTPQGGTAETGTFTATRTGDVWTVSSQSQGGQAGTYTITYTGHETGSYTITSGGGTPVSGTFTAVANGGTNGNTTAGTNGNTTAGTDGNTTDGTTAGTDGNTTAGTNGNTTAGTNGGTTGGQMPTSLSGRSVQLSFGSFGTLYHFTSDSAGTYEDGTPITSYSYDSNSHVLHIVEGVGVTDAVLTFTGVDANNNPTGTVHETFVPTGEGAQQYDGTFTITTP
jgi:hypothetical protein